MVEVSRELESSDVWNDPERAQALGKERAALERVIKTLEVVGSRLAEAEELLRLAEEESDAETAAAVVSDIDAVDEEVSGLEFRRMFSGEMDVSNAFVDIQAGSGGTEAQDWAEMLLRMYLRWAENHEFTAELIEVSAGDVAGIKSATVRVVGEYVFGWLRTETGVHRLVRKSPFDSGSRRHTSFASVFISPEIDDDIEIDINPAELRIDTYRASGAGGQHVNKTDSAIRLTHLPTGTVVECQEERSQHKNRAKAMAVLQSRIQAAIDEERASEEASTRKSLVGSGDRSERIRTYNYPQGRVSEHRINLTLYRLSDVVEGELDLILSPLHAEHQAELLASLADSE